MTNRVIAYYDGSNFYHLALDNYKLKGFDFAKLASDLIKDPDGQLIKVKYFIAPVNRPEEPDLYADQQKFFAKMKNDPLIEINLGKLVTRKLNQIWGVCKKCGEQLIGDANCPKCARIIDLKQVRKTVEKGVDVKLAITLLLIHIISILHKLFTNSTK